jgi:hypothetical protein
MRTRLELGVQHTRDVRLVIAKGSSIILVWTRTHFEHHPSKMI